MIARGVVAALVLVLMLPGVIMAATPVVGTIEGLISNGTAGGSSVAGLEVGLFSLNSDNTTGHWTAQTDASGRFVFGGVSSGAGNTFAVGMTFQGADYFTDVVSFAANETRKNVDLTVYDATSDDSAIRVVNAHTIVFVEEGVLRIQEVYVFANMSDRTYVGSGDGTGGGPKGTLRFSLPAGFAGLDLGGDLAAAGIMASSSGFVDTLPVQPGSRQAFYSYRVNLDSGTYTYERGVDYPTLKYSMLVQGDKVSIQGDRLTGSGTTDMGGTLFAGVAGTNLAPGTILSVRLSGLSARQNSPVLLWVGIGVAVLALGSLGVYLLKRNRPTAVAVDVQGEDQLLTAMVSLDEEFENGNIAEGAYREARARLKRELVELIGKTKGSIDGG